MSDTLDLEKLFLDIADVEISKSTNDSIHKFVAGFQKGYKQILVGFNNEKDLNYTNERVTRTLNSAYTLLRESIINLPNKSGEVGSALGKFLGAIEYGIANSKFEFKPQADERFNAGIIFITIEAAADFLKRNNKKLKLDFLKSQMARIVRTRKDLTKEHITYLAKIAAKFAK